MICSYGMDDTVGLAALSQDEAVKGPMAAKITERVNEILAAELNETVAQIEKANPKMDQAGKSIAEKNKLAKDQIKKALK